MLLAALLLVCNLPAQDEKEKSLFDDSNFTGLKMRNIGPAFCSGRIADIAIHPDDDNVWYVAVGSGGVWKTTNAAVTWKPLFDGQSVYSTGCVTIDPSNPSTIWVGTGENVGGRHVGFGDGIYRSTDEGKSWKNMGLKKSEHLSKIIVHPENSDVLMVAAQGPLWSSGGERGFYLSHDGGATWERTLGDDEWTGVTDIVIDPRDPNVVYAATWQRHRTIAAYMGGGPKSGLHKSLDGGKTWKELSNGVPKGNKGKIGLAISPQNPDVLYAAIELDRTKGGVFRSANRGASWQKMSDAVSGATGPHYYQELYASPHAFDRLYLMDVRIQVSDDGGKNFRRLAEEDKHSDNHAIAFRADDPDYLLVGTDAGIYESFDLAQNWRFIDNLPLTQYYKVAVDDAEPFYHVFGGTQDNGSHGGPSQTDNRHGIRNGDWYKTLFADGHQSATEPGNPNILYAETQQGGLHRIDRITGEPVFIQPQADEGGDFERFNWDAPIVVSPHNPARLYFASQRVWRSEDRGDSWTSISEDLTKNQERITLPIMGRQQSWDSPWDVGAMSNFNTISSLSESPLKAGLIYAGTDDGIIQITEDGGANWKKIEARSLPGVPANAFVNDIRADLHDEGTVYVCLDNHKEGDFKPYIFRSINKGQTWQSIAGNLPEKLLMWRTVQDHIDPSLIFAATEFGIYFTKNVGGEWTKISGGVPTIPFRDITIQRREDDLVGASFGRGFYILDDISVLRNVSKEQLAEEATLFPVKDADWYNPKSPGSSPGAAQYAAENPPFGAVFTYYLGEEYTTLQAERKKKEKALAKANQDVPFPGWDALDAEKAQEKPKILLTIKDATGEVVRKLEAPAKKGFHRVAWDFRYPRMSTVRLQSSGGGGRRRGGSMASPGSYSVSMAKMVDGMVTPLSVSQDFEVTPLYEGALPRATPAELAAYRQDLTDFQMQMSAATVALSNAEKQVAAFETALSRSGAEPGVLNEKLFKLKRDVDAMQREMTGSPAKGEIGERSRPTIYSRLGVANRGLSTTYGPTELHRNSLAIGKDKFAEVKEKLTELIQQKIPALEKEIMATGAPMIESSGISPKF